MSSPKRANWTSSAFTRWPIIASSSSSSWDVKLSSQVGKDYETNRASALRVNSLDVTSSSYTTRSTLDQLVPQSCCTCDHGFTWHRHRSTTASEGLSLNLFPKLPGILRILTFKWRASDCTTSRLNFNIFPAETPASYSAPAFVEVHIVAGPTTRLWQEARRKALRANKSACSSRAAGIVTIEQITVLRFHRHIPR